MGSYDPTDEGDPLMAEEVVFHLGRMIELTEKDRHEFQRLATGAYELANDQSPGWFVNYGRLITRQRQLISQVIRRCHDN